MEKKNIQDVGLISFFRGNKKSKLNWKSKQKKKQVKTIKITIRTKNGLKKNWMQLTKFISIQICLYSILI